MPQITLHVRTDAARLLPQSEPVRQIGWENGKVLLQHIAVELLESPRRGGFVQTTGTGQPPYHQCSGTWLVYAVDCP